MPNMHDQTPAGISAPYHTLLWVHASLRTVSYIIALLTLTMFSFSHVNCRNAHPFFFYLFLYVDKAFGNFYLSPLSPPVSWPLPLYSCVTFKRIYEGGFEISQRQENSCAFLRHWKAHDELMVQLKHRGQHKDHTYWTMQHNGSMWTFSILQQIIWSL